MGQPAKRNPEPGLVRPVASLLLALAMCGLPGILTAADLPANQPQRQQPFGAPLSLAEALNLALRQSPSILRAQKDLEASQGIVVQTRRHRFADAGGYRQFCGGAEKRHRYLGHRF